MSSEGFRPNFNTGYCTHYSSHKNTIRKHRLHYPVHVRMKYLNNQTKACNNLRSHESKNIDSTRTIIGDLYSMGAISGNVKHWENSKVHRTRPFCTGSSTNQSWITDVSRYKPCQDSRIGRVFDRYVRIRAYAVHDESQ